MAARRRRQRYQGGRRRHSRATLAPPSSTRIAALGAVDPRPVPTRQAPPTHSSSCPFPPTLFSTATPPRHHPPPLPSTQRPASERRRTKLSSANGWRVFVPQWHAGPPAAQPGPDSDHTVPRRRDDNEHVLAYAITQYREQCHYSMIS